MYIHRYRVRRVILCSIIHNLYAVLHCRDRKYKTDPRDRKPYCKDCFEKLLGHYGDAHEALGQFVQVTLSIFIIIHVTTNYNIMYG